MERAGSFTGRYHVLGGTLSAIDGVGPEQLGIDRLIARVEQDRVREVVLALSATVDGQTTGHYLAERLARPGVPSPAGLWGSGRRRAQLSGRGNPRRRPQVPSAGRLSRPRARHSEEVDRPCHSSRILEAPHPILKTSGRPVTGIDPALRRLMDDDAGDDVRRTGHRPRGAAGRRTKRVIVLDLDRGGRRAPARCCMANPEIIWRLRRGRDATRKAACRLPEHFAEVAAPAKVRVRYLDRDGVAQRDRGRGASRHAACSTRSTISTASCSSTISRRSSAT